MRMWLCNPKILCRQHLFGEHVEMHMFEGTINKGTNIDGYVSKNLLQLKDLKNRHDILAEEMNNRGYKHLSCLEFPILEQKYKEFLNITIDQKSSLNDLISRCPRCKKRYEDLVHEEASKGNSQECTMAKD